MLTKIQTQLLAQHPELSQKSSLFEYYVSLQFPDKQRKLISWWEQMIQSAIRKSGDLSLSPADLEVVFTLHGLKPVPLERVLEYLVESGKFLWEGRGDGKGKGEEKNKDNNQGWLGTLTSYIWSSTPTTLKSGFKTLSDQSHSRITPKSYLSQLQTQLQKTITLQLQQQKSISYDYILDKLKQQLPVGNKSVQQLLKRVEEDGWMLVEDVQGRKVIVRSGDKKEMGSRDWVQVEKSKFMLRAGIQQFQRKIEQRLRFQEGKMQEAKKYVQLDQNRAKRILGEVRTLRKTTEQYENRLKLLKQTLDSLQISQLNSTTIGLVSECQKIVQKTMVDSSQLENIKDKHLEIAVSQKEVNKQLEELAGLDGAQLEDQVQLMMAQLERDIEKDRVGKRKETNVKVEVPEKGKISKKIEEGQTETNIN